MSVMAVAKKRPTLIVGKPCTGKTHMAKEMLDEPLIIYADEFDLDSLSNEFDVLIEEVHHNANTDKIVSFIRNFRGNLVLTSNDKKSVPKQILNSCKIKLSGSKNYFSLELAPRSIDPFNPTQDIFALVADFLKNNDREQVRRSLSYNKPVDVFIMNALNESIHPNRLIFIDSRVKRRWPQSYFYEMLAYVHDGGTYGRVTMPKFSQNKEMRKICRRLKLKYSEEENLEDLLKDETFLSFAKEKLNNKEYRMLGLGEKPRKKRNAPIKPTSNLGEWYG